MDHIENLRNVSMTGRAAYLVLCAEYYTRLKQPGHNWSPLLNIIWSGIESDNWEEWDFALIEITPGNFLEYPDYESSDFECLSESEYTSLRPLYDIDDAEWPKLLACLRECVELYLYSSIPGRGEESLNEISLAIDTLKNNSVPIPDSDIVQFSSFFENEGWGKPFDKSVVQELRDATPTEY